MENHTFNIQIDDAEFKAKISNVVRELTRHWLKAVLEHFRAKNIKVAVEQAKFFSSPFRDDIIVIIPAVKGEDEKLKPRNALCFQINFYCEKYVIEHYLADFDFLEKDKVYILPKAEAK